MNKEWLVQYPFYTFCRKQKSIWLVFVFIWHFTSISSNYTSNNSFNHHWDNVLTVFASCHQSSSQLKNNHNSSYGAINTNYTNLFILRITACSWARIIFTPSKRTLPFFFFIIYHILSKAVIKELFFDKILLWAIWDWIFLSRNNKKSGQSDYCYVRHFD